MCKEFYTPSEIMKVLTISYPTFLRKVNDGTIPAIKIGRQYRIPSSFFDCLEKQALESTDRGNV